MTAQDSEAVRHNLTEVTYYAQETDKCVDIFDLRGNYVACVTYDEYDEMADGTYVFLDWETDTHS